MQTITHRVRTFLREQGAAIEPWSGLEATYSELYALLDRRRDDPALWGPLEGLLGEVLRHAADPKANPRLAAPTAELLSSWDAAELVASLRSALSGLSRPEASSNDKMPTYRSFTRELSPAVLGGFLVLGLAAAACSDGSVDTVAGTGGEAADTSSGASPSTGGAGTAGGSTGGTSTGGTTTDPVGTGTGGAAANAICVIADAEVLASTINDSVSSDDQKARLCRCMTNLSQDWRNGLTALFETGTPEEIATALYEITDCCYGPSGQSFSASALLAGTLCQPQTVYKGVTFPR